MAQTLCRTSRGKLISIAYALRRMLMYSQQRMYEVMIKDIIPQFPQADQDELRKAADLWRFPFWDWALKKKQEDGSHPNYDIPRIVKPETVEVRTPEGSETIPNPFHQFWMKDGVAMGDEKLKPDWVTREPVSISSFDFQFMFV